MKKQFPAKRLALILLPAVLILALGCVLLLRHGTGKIGEKHAEIPRLLQVETPEKPNNASSYHPDPDFSRSLRDFARDSTAALAGDFEENACYSPLSLYYALALTGSGADGATKAEFEDVLHGREDSWLKEQCAAYYCRHCRDAGDENTFLLANSLWLDGRCDFREDFISDAGKYFFSPLFRADFTDPALGEEMTKWVSENTGGLLNPSFSPSPDQRLSIINTVYYKGQWAGPFSREGNTEEKFHKEDGSVVTAEFMHRNVTYGNAYEGNGFLRASLVLRGEDQMIFILPDEGISPRDLLTDPDSFEKMFGGLPDEEYTGCQLHWSIPKFSFDCEYDLAEPLKTLGLETAFRPDLADFSGMGDDPLYVSGVRQGTHIGIDEDGVEAAAYTEVLMQATGAMASPPPERIIEMDLNRPFLFAIVSGSAISDSADDAGSLLFAGVCGDPAAVK